MRDTSNDALYEAVQAAYKVAQVADTPEAWASLREARRALWSAEDKQTEEYRSACTRREEVVPLNQPRP